MRSLVTFFLLGLSFGAGPCLASCGPLLISYIAGTGKNFKQALKAYALFSLGRVAVYILLSLVLFFLGEVMLKRHIEGVSRYVYIAGGSFIVLIGVLVAGGRGLNFKLCRLLQGKLFRDDKKSVLLLGAVIGLMPCLPLLGVFSYLILVSRAWYESLSFILSFSLGTFISPLILLAGLAGFIRPLLAKRQAYERIFSLICGLILVYLGLRLSARIF